MIYINGRYVYVSFRNEKGKYHRLTGPAVIVGEHKAWYIEDVKYTESEYHEKLKEMGL